MRFYTALLAAPPSVTKPNYPKWMLDDPRINVAVSRRAYALGVNHVEFQVDTPEELTAMRDRLHAADGSLIEPSDAACCHATSNRYWVTDPSSVAWEVFHTLHAIPIYGEDTEVTPKEKASACCVPAEAAPAPCCAPSVEGESRRAD